jgi:signal transduction histidine kinase
MTALAHHTGPPVRASVALGGDTGTVTWVIGGLLAVLIVALFLMVLRWRTRQSLHGLAGTVRDLASGQQTARASVAGPAPAREVAQAVNALAEESQRLRAEEAENVRLRTMAREVGFRIREHLRVEDLLEEARFAIEEKVDADAAHLHVLSNGDIGLPVGHEHDWLLPGNFQELLPPNYLDEATDMLRAQCSLVVQDMNGPDGYRLMTPALRETLSGAGVVSHLFTPFGVDSVLGFIMAERLRPGHPWTPAEIDAIQSIAADLGRALHHARLYEAENRLVEDLKRLSASRQEFFATVAHELRSPLTAIEGYAEMLIGSEAGDVSSHQARMLETINRNSVKLRRLVEDLLILAKVESGAEVSHGAVDVGQLITEAADAITPSADAAGLELAVTLPAPGTTIHGDAGQLDRVLANLLSNAVKYTPCKGRVAIAATVTGDHAVVTIADTGIGIPEEDRKKLFTRFYRASNVVSSSIPGTGLGLAIVASIIASHHGTIEMASSEGSGTTAVIRLPRHPAGKPDSGRPHEIPAVEHRQPVAGGAAGRRRHPGHNAER